MVVALDVKQRHDRMNLTHIHTHIKATNSSTSKMRGDFHEVLNLNRYIYDYIVMSN